MATDKDKTKEAKTSNTPNKLPLVFDQTTRRICQSKTVFCEPFDSQTYQEYVQYSFESQPVPGQTSTKEIEARFNNLAWSHFWKKDAGFKEWQRKRAEQA
jgi:hypothetical protein